MTATRAVREPFPASQPPALAGNLDYLERAERCMLKHLLAGRFETGDFGHRRFDETGLPALGGALVVLHHARPPRVCDVQRVVTA